MIKYCGAVAVLLLLVACSSTSDKRAFEREQAEIEAYILACHGGISVSLALKYDFVAPVAAEIERQGTANFLLDTFGWSALYDACYSGSEHCVELLLSRGADPSLRSDGELPIQVAWNSVYHYCTNSHSYNIIKEKKAEEIGRYKRILEMLSVPNEEFEPRSAEAVGSVALEVVSYFMYDSTDDIWEDGICLRVNDADCPAPAIEAFREKGFPVYPESLTSHQKVLLNVKWIDDYQAEVHLYIPVLCAWSARVTYAYGHWMVEYISGDEL